MSMLDAINQIFNRYQLLADLQDCVGCPACRWGTDTQDGEKICEHPYGMRLLLGGLRCANQQIRITTADTL